MTWGHPGAGRGARRRVNLKFAATGGQPDGTWTMKLKRFVFLAVLGAMLAAGCSTNNTKSSATDDDDKTYVTGSRLPVKDGSTSKSMSNKQDIDDMTKSINAYKPQPVSR
jgi:hypothetical protein